MDKFTPPDRKIEELRNTFLRAEPFRFLVIDNFLPRQQYEAASEVFPGPDAPMWLQYRSGRENKKLQSRNFDAVADPLASTLAMINSPSFVDWLGLVTGIENLLPDPEYHGGGLHQTLAGGHLGLHIDYNRHSTHEWYRRLNVILYFNNEWEDSWGGCLELWTDGVKACAHSIEPHGNRLVIFETTETSWHGHPDPLTPPPGVTRKSIAAYYYTEAAPQGEIAPEHNTVFQERPGETFKATPLEKVAQLVRALKIR